MQYYREVLESFLKISKEQKGRKPVSHLPSNSSVFALILAETSISVEDMCRQLRDQKRKSVGNSRESKNSKLTGLIFTLKEPMSVL